ncbi:MAG: DNA-binding response regulator [Balneola sp.]|nr:MAG: DNA-binding response regulator [Balneola sp.]
MITCIAIDDEPNALSVIESLAAKVDFLDLKKTFVDPLKAMNYLENNSIHLIFLDINMPEITGFDFLKLLPNEVNIIFTSAYSEYALQGYEVNAIDYLLKPFDFPRFLQAVNKVKKGSGTPFAHPEFVFLNTGTSKKKVLVGDILFLESDGNYVNYYTNNGKIMVRSSIKDATKGLPPKAFTQIQRSYVVALKWIEKIENNHVFISELEIPIGNTFKEEFLELLKNFEG